jgi:acetyl esterase/lipase
VPRDREDRHAHHDSPHWLDRAGLRPLHLRDGEHGRWRCPRYPAAGGLGEVRAPASTDIIQFIQALPHDPHLLGPVAAHVRMKAYGPGFSAARVSSLDGTPLAGRIGGPALKPRPGVVLVHGFRQTKDRKFVVELAELLARNGWRVLAIDLRGTARAVISLPLRSRAGGRRPRTSSQRRGT